MKILAFDTTNSTLSVAVLENRKVVAQKNILEENQHSTMLIPSIEECLHTAKIWYSDLDLIAFTNGPGSFTGIRVGYSSAKALAISTSVPIVAVNSLEAIAFGYLQENKKTYSPCLGGMSLRQQAMGVHKILVVNDARLQEFFVQEFVIENNHLQAVYEPLMIKIEEIGEYLPKGQFILAGSAKNMIKDGLENSIIFDQTDFIDAKNVGLLAEEIFRKQGEQINSEALYIRKPQISQRKRK